jgi:hypothetical protein
MSALDQAHAAPRPAFRHPVARTPGNAVQHLIAGQHGKLARQPHQKLHGVPMGVKRVDQRARVGHVSSVSLHRAGLPCAACSHPPAAQGGNPAHRPQRGFIRCRLDASTIRCPHAAAPDFWRNRAQRPHSLCSREPAQRMCSSAPGTSDSQAASRPECVRHGGNTVCTKWRQCGEQRVNIVLNMAAALWRHVGHSVATRWR